MKSIVEKMARMGMIMRPRDPSDDPADILQRVTRSDIKKNIRLSPATPVLVRDTERGMLEDLSVNNALQAVDSILERVVNAPMTATEQTMMLYLTVGALGSLQDFLWNSVCESMAVLMADDMGDRLRKASPEEKLKIIEGIIAKMRAQDESREEAKREEPN